MVRRKDVVGLFFLCLCFFYVCPAHPCGENPMQKVEDYAKDTGKNPFDLLHNLEVNNYRFYRQLKSQLSSYKRCLSQSETGYFKRTGPESKETLDEGGLLFYLMPDSYNENNKQRVWRDRYDKSYKDNAPLLDMWP